MNPALKRLASAVRFRPWPPCFQQLTSTIFRITLHYVALSATRTPQKHHHPPQNTKEKPQSALQASTDLGLRSTARYAQVSSNFLSMLRRFCCGALFSSFELVDGASRVFDECVVELAVLPSDGFASLFKVLDGVLCALVARPFRPVFRVFDDAFEVPAVLVR